MNWDNFTFIDLFAGIGGIRLGFESVGGKCVFSSEFDADACKTYEANFGEYPSGDITKIEAKDIPDFDILLGGFPCQAFSISGKQKGFEDTRGTLFFEMARIIAYHKPRVLFMENVKNLVQHDEGRTFNVILDTLKELGYQTFFKVLLSRRTATSWAWKPEALGIPEDGYFHSRYPQHKVPVCRSMCVCTPAGGCLQPTPVIPILPAG